MLIYMALIDESENQSKFEEIYNTYKGLMFYVANKILNNEADSEDAVHNAFITIAENIKKVDKAVCPKTQNYVAAFEKAMDDDFNTADAIAAIFDLVKYANTTANGDSSKAYVTALYELIVKLADVLGIVVEKKEELLDADIEALIQERQAARKERNFARADEIRDELLAKGIILEDTREGVKWSRA